MGVIVDTPVTYIVLMKITYNYPLQLQKQARGDDFLLTNRKGGFLTLSEDPVSRYQGWFVADESFNVFKIIESISPSSNGTIKEIVNNLWSIKRIGGYNTEEFIYPAQYNSFIYQLDKESEVEITLDIKKVYENPEFGRLYKVKEERGCILIEFEQENDFSFYLAIKTNKGGFQQNDEWIERYYSRDKHRNSPPWNRYVYKPITLKGKTFVFSANKDKKRAIEEAGNVFNRVEALKQREKNRKTKALGIKKTEVKSQVSNTGEQKNVALLCAKNSLYELLNYTGANLELRYRLYAGLPWFFQFWSRDFFISLEAIKKEGLLKTPQIKTLFFDVLKMANNSGYVPRILPKMKEQMSEGETSDSFGWLMMRVNQMLHAGKFGFLERRELKRHIEPLVKNILHYHTWDGFAYSPPHSTWMDSLEREGLRIENQALRLNIYNLAYHLTGNPSYAELEDGLLKKTRKHFWNGEILFDGKQDDTIRPNVFLAAYIYPQLLTREEWITCFENTLPSLWLEWGGLSSINKEGSRFRNEHTGEDDESYHQGDSWFYLNNMAALMLYHIGKNRFHSYIEKTIRASTEEILSRGALGHHAEISSAKELGSEGCLAQAWSSAMYIELIREIY